MCGSSAFFLEGNPWRQAPNNFTTKVPAWVTNLPPRRRDGVDRGARGATLASPLPLLICSAAATSNLREILAAFRDRPQLLFIVRRKSIWPRLFYPSQKNYLFDPEV